MKDADQHAWKSRTPQGVRGLKYSTQHTRRAPLASHPARGAWIEMFNRSSKRLTLGIASHPARGAWIEICETARHSRAAQSHPARGAWIEIRPLSIASTSCGSRTPQGVRGLKSLAWLSDTDFYRSHPARGAWIEIVETLSMSANHPVAPRKGCGD